MWYWSADTLFWQVSIDHSMDVQYQRSTRQTKAVCLWQPIIWIMAAMLCDSVVVVRTRPRAIPLAKITMRKSTHGFPSLFYTCLTMGLRLAGAPLLINNEYHIIDPDLMSIAWFLKWKESICITLSSLYHHDVKVRAIKTDNYILIQHLASLLGISEDNGNCQYLHVDARFHNYCRNFATRPTVHTWNVLLS